jgi:hypothetical protein
LTISEQEKNRAIDTVVTESALKEDPSNTVEEQSTVYGEVLQGEVIPNISTLSVKKKSKYIPTLADKEALASFVLSVIGFFALWGLPIHILALILGIRGRKSDKRKTLARIGIGITVFSMSIFVILTILIITNYNLIVNSDFFATLFYSFF